MKLKFLKRGRNIHLEIISPGRLPNSMTIEKMLADQRSPRNPIIMEVLCDYGYVDARGMGGVRRCAANTGINR